MTPRLTLEGITRAFGDERVVNDVSLSVSAGEVMCLLGPSGCGKSTTLRMAAGVDRPSEGAILLDDTVVSDAKTHIPPEQRSIGLMFQDFALFPHLTVAENVAFGLGRRSDRKAIAEQYLEKVGLTGFGPKYPHLLSGGEQQRVALARALVTKPRVMLMDEPFSGLDNRLRDAVRDETLALLKEEGAAVLLVTHDPEEAMKMADRIALMRGGRIVQIGAPYEIYANPVDRAAAAFFSDINVISARIEGSEAATPFGSFPANGSADGAAVELVVRPEHLTLARAANGSGDGAKGRVSRARFVGSESLIELVAESGEVMRATVPGVFLPETGEELFLSLDRENCHLFPAG